MPLTDEVVKAFEEMGVGRLILLQMGQNQEELLAYVDQVARDYIQ